jgi:hypothetical protein
MHHYELLMYWGRKDECYNFQRRQFSYFVLRASYAQLMRYDWRIPRTTIKRAEFPGTKLDDDKNC